MEKIIEEIKEKLDLIISAIMGDPNDISNPGIMIRLDRLERSNKTLRNCLYLVSSATLVMLGNLVLKLI